jgi:hypothetical protein
MTDQPARWEVAGRDLLGQRRPTVVTLNERADVVLLPPPPGGTVVDPESEFDNLIDALNQARALAREIRGRPS